MGFWQATKNYINSKVNEAGIAVGNKVSDLSVLSRRQLEEVEQLHKKYYAGIDSEWQVNGDKLLAESSVVISNVYLNQIKDLYKPIAREKTKTFESYNIRYIKLTRLVKDTKENSLEKLVNVYEVLSQEDCTIGLIFNRKRKCTDVYLGVVNEKEEDNNANINMFAERLEDAINGNFPGTKFDDIKKGVIPCLSKLEDFSVATISNIPTEKSEKFISQTIEKLLDGSVPENDDQEYTIILLAKPVLDTAERKLFWQERYSLFSPYASWQQSFTYTEAQTDMSLFSGGLGGGANGSFNALNTQNETILGTLGRAVRKGTGSFGEEFVNATNNFAGTAADGNIGKGIDGLKKAAKDIYKEANIDDTMSGIKNGFRASGQSMGKQTGNGFGFNFGLNFNRTSAVSVASGKNEGMTKTYVNYSVQHMLEILKHQIDRYDKGTALGMWDFAAYVVSKDFVVANNVAHSYLALTQGEESYVSQAAINLWRGDVSEVVSTKAGYAKIICSYLKELRHPEFCLSKELLEINPDWSLYPLVVSPTTCVSGKELSYALNFPQKSIAGMTVIQCAEFGRNITTYEDDTAETDNKTVDIGKIFHMHSEEENRVSLSKDSLASHVFVTGSTGVGKSNTVYKLLEKVAGSDDKVKFMIIEPAKGEYKNSLGKLANVKVYGTNPNLMALLRINPFSFPKDIHVTEHIDRLVELFNVCWPMYAAMPAVLKDAVERAYKDCGWNLAKSSNNYDEHFYPTFKDVADNVKKIIDESDYDVLNKGAYKGALLTRLQSLTNGVNGMIFNSNELSNEDLFEQNVIVDLSRIGSQETKSLVMGMLVLKLQEYHLDKMDNDSHLKHVTVLEEAHNLLKRSAVGGIEEGGNLQGKSVEMISNAIAEMRTYGEGFVIVDQAPGLLDMAAIRNTNTKIILRLPDLSDRELVGRAANLNDDQVNELARLPRGVAAVYHNEWVEPVLCKVEKFEKSEKCKYDKDNDNGDIQNIDLKLKIVTSKLKIVTSLGNCECADSDAIEKIKREMKETKIRASVQVKILSLLQKPLLPLRMRQIAPIVANLYGDLYEKVKLSYSKSKEPMEWTKDADVELLRLYGDSINERLRRIILHGLLLQYLCTEVRCEEDFQRWVEGRFVR